MVMSLCPGEIPWLIHLQGSISIQDMFAESSRHRFELTLFLW
jgi:hypothetical protein